MEGFFIGQIAIDAGSIIPVGWAARSGQLVPIEKYQVLFSLIGTKYGGDGHTTFGVPHVSGPGGIAYLIATQGPMPVA